MIYLTTVAVVWDRKTSLKAPYCHSGTSLNSAAFTSSPCRSNCIKISHSEICEVEVDKFFSVVVYQVISATSSHLFPVRVSKTSIYLLLVCFISHSGISTFALSLSPFSTR